MKTPVNIGAQVFTSDIELQHCVGLRKNAEEKLVRMVAEKLVQALRAGGLKRRQRLAVELQFTEDHVTDLGGGRKLEFRALGFVGKPTRPLVLRYKPVPILMIGGGFEPVSPAIDMRCPACGQPRRLAPMSGKKSQRLRVCCDRCGVVSDVVLVPKK